MKDILEETGRAYPLIAHDLSMVRYISDRIGVPHLCHLVETGTADEIFANPVHPLHLEPALRGAGTQPRGGEGAPSRDL